MAFRAHHRLFLSYLLLVGLLVVVLALGVEATLREPLLQQAQDELQRELALGREIFEGAAGAEPDSLARHLSQLTGHRVTVVAPDGQVLGDSGVEPDQVAGLDNHAGRPEVLEAVSEGRGAVVRYSTSVNAELLYAAALSETGAVIRFAVGIEEIDAAVARVRWQILQVGGLALVLAGLLSLAMSTAITRPLRRMRDVAGAMARGELDTRVRSSRTDELGELADALDGLAGQLQRRVGQLEADREEMQALIDSMTEAVLAFDADGTVRRANPAARRIFGLGSEPTGRPPETVARQRGFLEMVERVQRGESVSPSELTLGERHLLATGEPLPRGGSVLVFVDTTELRRLEGVRRDFVANASHELKTPLTVIRGNAETLLDEDLPPELRRRFTRALHANAERLQSILDDLLDLSRIESGGWKVDPEPVSASGLIESAWEPFRPEASEKGVSFRLDVEDGIRAIQVDPAALRQVLANLFSNALRYTPEGGTITAVVTSAGPDEIVLEVRDTGSGIPSVHLSRIFERFYRVDPGRSRAEGGTGLGLAIVRHLVEGHGGRVEAESELGVGTTIRIVLPRRPRPPEHSSPSP